MYEPLKLEPLRPTPCNALNKAMSEDTTNHVPSPSQWAFFMAAATAPKSLPPSGMLRFWYPIAIPLRLIEAIIAFAGSTDADTPPYARPQNVVTPFDFM